MTWYTLLYDYKMYLKLEKSLSDNTLDNYLRDIVKLQTYVENNINPTEVTQDQVREFIYQLAKTDYNPRSQARVISALKSFFKYLILEELITHNPMQLMESPRIGMKLPDTLSLMDINNLISAIDLGKPSGERDRAILEMLYGCGLRVSELINLNISDLYFDEDFIRVTGKGDKQRLVPIGKYTIKYINLYKNNVRVHQTIDKKNEDILFLNHRGNGLSRVAIFMIIKNLAIKIGLDKRISPHTFRHSFATHLLENGGSLRAIQLMLGHESITTTEIYTHLDQRHLREAIINYHPRNK